MRTIDRSDLASEPPLVCIVVTMSNPVVSPEAIDALRAVAPDDGGVFLTELIDIFVADTPARLQELITATAAGDAKTATRAAHSVKGSAGNFGASELARLALEVELAAKAGAFDDVRAKTPALAAAAAEVCAALNALRSP